MFNALDKINSRPEPFEFYTAEELWTNEHTSEMMLQYHLNETVDLSSRNSKFITRSVEWINTKFQIGNQFTIADFGCGPGLYSSKLAKLQAKVTGIDFSKRSIRYAKEFAKKENISIKYLNQNYLEFETDESFDLIIMIMCDFCALSPAQRKTMLQKFYTMLKSDGKVLLDVYSLAGFNQREESAVYEINQLNSFWSPHKYYGFQNCFKYVKEKVVLDKFTIIEEKKTRTVFNWLQYFSPETLESEFISSGFMIEEFYADVAGSKFDPDKTEFAVIARKK